MTEVKRNGVLSELCKILKDFEVTKQKYIELPDGKRKHKMYSEMLYVIEDVDKILFSDHHTLTFVRSYCKTKKIDFNFFWKTLHYPSTFEFGVNDIINTLQTKE